LTRSEIAVPLLIRGRLLGVLDIQSDKPSAFTTQDLDVFETLADQLAVAIDNARLLEESAGGAHATGGNTTSADARRVGSKTEGEAKSCNLHSAWHAALKNLRIGIREKAFKFR
jgi:signal transduction protein with GAF and PtsI domain